MVLLIERLMRTTGESSRYDCNDAELNVIENGVNSIVQYGSPREELVQASNIRLCSRTVPAMLVD